MPPRKAARPAAASTAPEPRGIASLDQLSARKLRRTKRSLQASVFDGRVRLGGILARQGVRFRSARRARPLARLLSHRQSGSRCRLRSGGRRRAMSFRERLPNRRCPQRTTRRDAPVRCASCGRQVKRRGRRQLYCSTRCRKRAHYAESVRRGDFSAFPLSDTALGTIPQKRQTNSRRCSGQNRCRATAF